MEADQDKPLPSRADFEDDRSWLRALVAWGARQEMVSTEAAAAWAANDGTDSLAFAVRELLSNDNPSGYARTFAALTLADLLKGGRGRSRRSAGRPAEPEQHLARAFVIEMLCRLGDKYEAARERASGLFGVVERKAEAEHLRETARDIIAADGREIAPCAEGVRVARALDALAAHEWLFDQVRRIPDDYRR